MSMAELWHFEDFAPGQIFSLGPYPVSKDEIIAYARDYDPQPQHLSEEGGRDSILGRLFASGWHVCAIAMRMLDDGIFLRSAFLSGLGVDETRWFKPVFADDVLSGTALVLDCRLSTSNATRGYVRMRVDLTRPGPDGTPEPATRLSPIAIIGTRGG